MTCDSHFFKVNLLPHSGVRNIEPSVLQDTMNYNSIFEHSKYVAVRELKQRWTRIVWGCIDEFVERV